MALVIGLTGGIASGKSTVSNMLRSKGYTVIDADLSAREVVEVGKRAYHQIIDAFGRDILHEDKSLNREKLGSIVFHNAEKRNRLNSIVHPAIRSHMLDQKDQAVQNGKNTIIMDIPLLFESKLTWMVEKTVVVFVDPTTQLKRLKERNQFPTEEAEARIKSQLPLVEKVKLADEVINNNGSIEETEQQVEELIKNWNLII